MPAGDGAYPKASINGAYPKASITLLKDTGELDAYTPGSELQRSIGEAFSRFDSESRSQCTSFSAVISSCRHQVAARSLASVAHPFDDPDIRIIEWMGYTG